MNIVALETEIAAALKEVAKVEVEGGVSKDLAEVIGKHAHSADGKHALVQLGDEIIHFDIFKAVTAGASFLTAIAKGISDPTFVSWVCVLAGLSQIRDLKKRLSPYSARICVLLFDRSICPRDELLQIFVTESKHEAGEKEFSFALSELTQLGCLRESEDGWIELRERIIYRP